MARGSLPCWARRSAQAANQRRGARKVNATGEPRVSRRRPLQQGNDVRRADYKGNLGRGVCRGAGATLYRLHCHSIVGCEGSPVDCLLGDWGGCFWSANCIIRFKYTLLPRCWAFDLWRLQAGNWFRFTTSSTVIKA